MRVCVCTIQLQVLNVFIFECVCDFHEVHRNYAITRNSMHIIIMRHACMHIHLYKM